VVEAAEVVVVVVVVVIVVEVDEVLLGFDVGVQGQVTP
jgi:hypothetical protein